MKSKKAINMIEKTAFPNGFLSGRFNGQCGHDVMAVCDVMTAVEYAEQEAEERLTRWNDPKEPPTHLNIWMLLKCADGKFDTGYWNGRRWKRWMNCEIIGWREIHE